MQGQLVEILGLHPTDLHGFGAGLQGTSGLPGRQADGELLADFAVVVGDHVFRVAVFYVILSRPGGIWLQQVSHASLTDRGIDGP